MGRPLAQRRDRPACSTISHPVPVLPPMPIAVPRVRLTSCARSRPCAPLRVRASPVRRRSLLDLACRRSRLFTLVASSATMSTPHGRSHVAIAASPISNDRSHASVGCEDSTIAAACPRPRCRPDGAGSCPILRIACSITARLPRRLLLSKSESGRLSTGCSLDRLSDADPYPQATDVRALSLIPNSRYVLMEGAN